MTYIGFSTAWTLPSSVLISAMADNSHPSSMYSDGICAFSQFFPQRLRLLSTLVFYSLVPVIHFSTVATIPSKDTTTALYFRDISEPKTSAEVCYAI